jgi:hypothetical protein
MLVLISIYRIAKVALKPPLHFLHTTLTFLDEIVA